MCQEMHRGEKSEPMPISSFGDGYKIFRVYSVLIRNPDYVMLEPSEQGMVMPASHETVDTCDSMISGAYNSSPVDGWVKWLNNSRDREEGFCFFMTEAEAQESLTIWNRECYVPENQQLVIKKINYREGLGQCTETNFVRGYRLRMCLCRTFRIAKGEDLDA